MSGTAVVPSLPADAPLVITLLSDTHVGTGAGVPGAADRSVARDETGLPYLPGKTLTGVVRDTAFQVAWALDNQAPAAWSAWARWVFGGPEDPTPAPAAVGIRPAHLSAGLRAVLQQRPLLTAASTIDVPGVAIDDATGTATDHSLRLMEAGRVGLTFHTTCVWEEPPPPEAAFLFSAAATLTRHLGGKRRRGFGHVRLEISGETTTPSDWIDWARRHSPAPAPSPPERRIEIRPPAVRQDQGDEATWWRLPLSLTALTDLIVNPTTSGNVVTSDERIPGSVLLPLVTGSVTGAGAALADGDLMVGDGVPVPGDGWTVRRVAQTLVADKDEPAATHLVNLAAVDDIDPRYRSIGGWLAWPASSDHSSSTPVLWRPQQVARAHNTVAADRQRPDESTGGLFTYVALAAGTKFLSFVYLRGGQGDGSASSLADVVGAIAGEHRVGRSSKDDYGRVFIETGTPERWCAEPGSGTSSSTTEQFSVLVTSDMLLLDERLRPDPTPERLARTLSERLGVEVHVDDTTGSGAPMVAASTATARNDAWVRRWHLPRASLVGLSAGSVVRLRALQPVQTEQIGALSFESFGQRTAEGFGQLVIDPPELAFARLELAPDPAVGGPADRDAPTVSLSEEELASLDEIERSAWSLWISHAAEQAAKSDWAGVLQLGRTTVTNSQLGALRTAAMSGNLDELSRWLDGVEETTDRKNAWPEPTRRWLRERLASPLLVFDDLGLTDAWASQLSASEASAATRREELAVHALVALLTTACGQGQRVASQARPPRSPERTDDEPV